MTDELVLTPDLSKSGTIVYQYGFTAYVGYDCWTGQNENDGALSRGYLSFDTSGLPAGAEILYVNLLCRRGSDPVGMPTSYLLKISMGTFIGPTLDGNSGEWTGGTLTYARNTKPSDRELIDLASTGGSPELYVNRDGYTDLRIWDASVDSDPDDIEWATVFNIDEDTLCRLVIGYTTPSGTAVGEGDAGASATVTRGMSCEAVGVGSVVGDAALLLSGVCVAVGDCEVTGSAGLRLEAGELVGVGEAAVACAGGLSLVTSGVATGESEVAATASRLLGASCEVVGIAVASAVAGVVLSSLLAEAVGEAWASCILQHHVDVEPYALHSATRSIESTHSATRAVGGVHTAEVACGNQNTGTRGPRRGN